MAHYLDTHGLQTLWNKIKSTMQSTLVSGTNIKTINGNSVLGSGDLEISADNIHKGPDAPIDTSKLWIDTDDTSSQTISVVGVSATGTSTDEVNYITINGVEKKIGGNSQNVSNKNLFYNPWFTINQRNQSIFESSPGTMHYCVDMWKTDGEITINTDKTLTITKLNDGTYFEQILDFYDDMDGITYTLSFVDGSDALHSHTFIANTSATQVIYEDTHYKVSFAHGDRGITFYFKETVTIKAMKLEVGSVSTLSNDSAPNDAEELLRCQHYLYRIMSTHASSGIIAVFRANSTTQARATIPTPTWMRGDSIAMRYDGVTVFELGTGTTVPITNIVANGGGSSHLTLIMLGNFTQQKTYSLLFNTTSGYLEFSAEL